MTFVQTQFNQLSAAQRSFVGALFAFVGYGAWAFLVNYSHGSMAALKAMCVQGSYSFIVTLLVSLLMESLHQYLLELNCSKQVSVLLTVLITCVTLYTSSWLVNVLAGTPEIFKTVILGYVLGTIYTILYSMGLSRLEIVK